MDYHNDNLNLHISPAEVHIDANFQSTFCFQLAYSPAGVQMDTNFQATFCSTCFRILFELNASRYSIFKIYSQKIASHLIGEKWAARAGRH
jgi:hypothetical protein